MAACLCPAISSPWPVKKFFQILLPFVKLAKGPGGRSGVTEGGGKGGLSLPGFPNFGVDLSHHTVKPHADSIWVKMEFCALARTDSSSTVYIPTKGIIVST